MNKRIVELLSQYDFKFEKNSAYGHIEGYEVNVLLNTMGIGPIFIFSTHLSQEQKSDFVAKMNARKLSLVQVQSSMFGLEIVIGSATLGSFVKKFPNVLAAILEELAAVQAIFLGTFLYKKFGGKENAMMIIMSFVTTILMILLTLLLVYISAANNIVDNAMKGFEALAYCIKNDVAFKAEFIMDLAINAVFAILGEVYSIFSLVKKIKRPKSIQ